MPFKGVFDKFVRQKQTESVFYAVEMKVQSFNYFLNNMNKTKQKKKKKQVNSKNTFNFAHQPSFVFRWLDYLSVHLFILNYFLMQNSNLF